MPPGRRHISLCRGHLSWTPEWCMRMDTSAYSHFKRGDPPVVDLVDAAEWVGLPSIVLGELWVGFLLGGRVDIDVEELRAFLAHPVVHEIVVDGDVGRIYGEIVVALREAGT